MIEANRGFILLDRHQPHGLYGVYADTTAGFYWTVFWPFLPRTAYRDEAMRREVDAVFDDLGVEWPLTSPTSGS